MRPRARSSVVVEFSPDGTPRLDAAGAGVLGRPLAIVARAEAEGTWARLKVCPADDCGWAFYDFSRNHSRTWCSMSACGNRAKARSYRSRQPKASRSGSAPRICGAYAGSGSAIQASRRRFVVGRDPELAAAGRKPKRG